MCQNLQMRAIAQPQYLNATANKYPLCHSGQINECYSQYTCAPLPRNTSCAPANKYRYTPANEYRYAPANKIHVMPQLTKYMLCLSQQNTLYMICPSQQTTRMLHTCICMPQLRNTSYVPANKYMTQPSQQILYMYKICPSQQYLLFPSRQNTWHIPANKYMLCLS